MSGIQIPLRNPHSSHVFHQYTLKVPAEIRDVLREELKSKGIPSMVYYPIPLHRQKAYARAEFKDRDFPVTLDLCKRVLSLPIHTEMNSDMLQYISETFLQTLKKHSE